MKENELEYEQLNTIDGNKIDILYTKFCCWCGVNIKNDFLLQLREMERDFNHLALSLDVKDRIPYTYNTTTGKKVYDETIKAYMELLEDMKMNGMIILDRKSKVKDRIPSWKDKALKLEERQL